MKDFQFRKDIDASFCIAYANLGGEKKLLKRRLQHFLREFGQPLDEMYHTANRMSLLIDDEDYDPSALDKTRNFTHTLAIGWIYKRRKLYDHIQGALDKELEEGFNNEED